MLDERIPFYATAAAAAAALALGVALRRRRTGSPPGPSPAPVALPPAALATGVAPAVLVTGGSRGLGAATARALAADGWEVLLVYQRRADAAEEVVKSILAAGGRASALQADLCSADEVARTFAWAKRVVGSSRLQAVVVNHGVNQPGPCLATSDAALDLILSTNVRSAYMVLREAARSVRDGGSIVAISSSLVGSKVAGNAAYAGSKAALETIVAVLAKELKGRLTVNCIAPGPIESPMFYQGKTAAQVQFFKDLAPSGRLGQPDDVAGAVRVMLAGHARAPQREPKRRRARPEPAVLGLSAHRPSSCPYPARRLD